MATSSTLACRFTFRAQPFAFDPSTPVSTASFHSEVLCWPARFIQMSGKFKQNQYKMPISSISMPLTSLWEHTNHTTIQAFPTQNLATPVNSAPPSASTDLQVLSTYYVDPNLIKACQDLVEHAIGAEFEDADSTEITGTPQKVVEYWPVALWAQHLGQGSLWVNLRWPGLLHWLKKLAGSDTGPSGVYGNVEYKFIESMLPINRLTSGGKYWHSHHHHAS